MQFPMFDERMNKCVLHESPFEYNSKDNPSKEAQTQLTMEILL